METPRTIAVAGATGRAGRQAVDILRGEGHNVVVMSRSSGVDVVTGEGLAKALVGVQSIIDVATGDSPEQAAATEFFTAAARNLQEAGAQAGVERIVVVSIIGVDRFTGGYGAAKLIHEQALLAGPLPVQILRAAQFHELVAQLTDWGRQGEVSYVQKMQTQLVSARAVAQELADLASRPGTRAIERSHPGDRRAEGRGSRRDGDVARGPAGRSGQDRRCDQPGRPRREALRGGCATSGPPREAGRPDL